MTSLDPRLLRSFVVLAHRLSFTRAAKELNMSQPTLTLQIQKLETELGFPLFIRSTRQIAVTAQGHELLPLAERLITDSKDTERMVRLIRERDKPRIRLGAPIYTMNIPVRNRLIERFAELYPHIELVIHNDWQPQLLRALEKGTIDVALVSGLGVPRDVLSLTNSHGHPYEGLYPADLDTIVIDRQRVGLLVPRGTRLAEKPEIDPQSLRGHSIVVIKNVCPPVFDSLYALFDANGVRQLEAPEENATAIQRYARRMGMSSVSIGWFDELTGPKDPMIKRFISGVTTEVELALVTRGEADKSELKALLQLARQIAASDNVLCNRARRTPALAV